MKSGTTSMGIARYPSSSHSRQRTPRANVFSPARPRTRRTTSGINRRVDRSVVSSGIARHKTTRSTTHTSSRPLTTANAMCHHMTPACQP